MKILVISDEIDPLVYSNAIKERFRDVKLVISCGDLPYDYYDYIVSCLNIPLFYVLGNHPPPIKQNRTGMTWQEDSPPGCINLHNRVVRYRGLILAGMEGCLRYNRDEWSKQYTQFEVRAKLWGLWPKLLFNRLFRGRALDIFVSHAPPFGIHDLPDRCHTGFKAFLPFMRRFRPRLLLHGHVHLYDLNEARETPYAATRVINGYGYRVVDLD